MGFDKNRATAIAPKITASLSIIGSIFIITDIVKSKEKMGRTYSRILLLMSIYDLMTSIAQGLSTWPIPADSGRTFAAGNTFTCTFQGFFTQLGVGAPLINCSLSFYYLIVIAFAFSEDRVKKIEWFMHGIPLLFSISTAILGLPLTLYNNAYLWCWIAALPGSCENGTNQGGEGPCERGHYAWIYRWTIYYGPIWLCIMIITFNMTVVSYLVWAKERASLKFKFGHNSSAQTTMSTTSRFGEPSCAFGDDGANERAKTKAQKLAAMFSKKQNKERKKKQRQGLASQVFWQAFYYVVGFYITWITPTMLRMLQTLGKPVPYWILFSMSCLLPFQGFFNFLIYVRPRVVQYRQRHPEKTLCNALSRALARTVTVVYSSASRSFNETELEDIETLDPCYAMQKEKEQEETDKKEKKEAKNRKANAVAKMVIEEEKDGHDDPFHDESDKMEQRRKDEMKLLSDDDPSFHEDAPNSKWTVTSSLYDEVKSLATSLDMEMDGSNIGHSFGHEAGDSNMLGPSNHSRDTSNRGAGNNDDSSVGDLYTDEPEETDDKPPTELWKRPPSTVQASQPVMSTEPAVEKAPEQAKQQTATGSTKPEEVPGSEGLEETLQNREETIGGERKNSFHSLRKRVLHCYPEFQSDPDFYFL